MVENFRGFRYLELPGLGRVNLIAGANNSGKTAALEAIYLHASGPFAGRTAIRALNPARGFTAIRAEQDSSPWDVLFPSFTGRTPIRLSALTSEGSYQLELRIVGPDHYPSDTDVSQIESAIQGMATRAFEIRETRSAKRRT